MSIENVFIGSSDLKRLEKKDINVPNMLSLLRIFIIVPFIIFFIKERYIISGIMLAISGISDMLDGFIARKFHCVTRLGQILDPVADKLTLAAVVICLGIKFPSLLVIVIILLFKDSFMLIGGFILLKNGIDPPASQWYGKLATAFFYFSVIAIVGTKAIFDMDIPKITFILLTITAVLMVFSLINYFLLFLNLMKNGNNEK